MVSEPLIIAWCLFQTLCYSIDGKTRVTSKAARLKALVETIHAWNEDPAPHLSFARFFLFYDHTSDSHLPCVAQLWHDVIRELNSVTCA